MAIEEIRAERIKKLEAIREKNLDPYPAKARRSFLIGEVSKKFSTFVKTKRKVTVVGRIMARREHGGSMFLDLRDESGTIQLFLKKDVLGANFNRALETVDIGDFLQAEGHPFNTKRGEPTLEVIHWIMLAKSLRPLPEKWHGLTDTEERFRKRYLDMLMNDGVRARFETRSRIVRKVRTFFEKREFLEVETPMLHPIPGGALARPFKTHHNALAIELYLRIAKELYLKRLLVGGLEKVFEIGKDFRNEGIDTTHNPEFTMLEAYVAYWDEETMMKLVEDLFIDLAKEFGKNQEITHEDKKIIFKKPFPRVSFKDVLARYALIPDFEGETRESLIIRARRLGVEVAPHQSKGKIADEIYKKICRPYLIQPTFLIHHPLDISPLAKKHDNPNQVRRFQLVSGGFELANGFAELNDPVDQRERFTMQAKDKSEGEEETHPMDEEYIEALEYGMPPAAGLGIGIDRLIMLFTNTKNIREVVLFPTLRPK